MKEKVLTGTAGEDAAERIVTETPSKSVLDDLLQDFDKSTGGRDEVYTVEIENGREPCPQCKGLGIDRKAVEPIECDQCTGSGFIKKKFPFRFRTPNTLDEMRAFKRAAALWVLKMQSDKPKPDALAQALEGRTSPDLITAFTLKYWSVDEYTDVDWLKITRAPALANMLLEAVNQKFDAGYSASVVDVVESKKKD